jgi:hypothetical protein
LSTRASEARATEARARADASFKKEERAKEGAKAMQEYEANGRVVRENMMKLRALRLAKEAAEQQPPPAVEPVSKPAVRRKKKQ